MYEPSKEETGKTTGGGESPSAYASAESSPLQSLQSYSSLKQSDELATGGHQKGLVNSSSAVGIVTMGKSDYESANDLINDYQSLPNFTGAESVKDIIEKTVKSSIEELTAAKKSPTKTSPESTSQRTSMLSLLGRMFQKSDSKKKEVTAATSATTSTLPSVSSSSPNPECSPYKLLNAKQPEQQQESTNNEHLEKLAALNHKEHEKVDPILSSASIKLVDNDAAATKLSSSQQTAASSTTTMSAAVVSTEASAPSAKCMPVPASSHEFCMDLNLNLAAAASADLDSHNKASTTSPQKECDHNRFTKNASTSSIHNDLKLILEEGKEKSPTTSATEKSAVSTSAEQKIKDEVKTEPKPQRDRSHKSKHGKHSGQSKSTKNGTNQSPLAKIITEMENDKRRSSSGESKSSSSVPPNRYRYSKDLLNRIKDERASLISNMLPEIFKAYSYCMTGKYWDPEKYFDVVQYGTERNQQPNKPYNKNNNRGPRMNTNNNNNNNNNINNISNNSGNNYYKKPNYNNQYHNNSNTFNRQNRPYNYQNRSGDSMSNNADVDKMLLNMVKPKTTPNVNLMDILNKKQTTNIIGDLFASAAVNNQLDATNTPKHYPLILTAQELEFSQLCTNAGLINHHHHQLQKSSKTPDRSGGLLSLSQRMNNSLESCGSPSGSSTSSSSRNSTHHHHHNQRHVNTDLDNSSDAYKQLVKNLSNHPLSAASQPSKCSDIDQLLLKLNDNKQRSASVASENPSQILKKLLHLDSQQSKSGNKSRQHHHNHHNNRKPKSTQETVTPETSGKTAMEELMLKLKQKTPSATNSQHIEQQHFNGLINKLMPSLANHITIANGANVGGKQSNLVNVQTSSANNNSDILKWFKEPNAV